MALLLNFLLWLLLPFSDSVGAGDKEAVVCVSPLIFRCIDEFARGDMEGSSCIES